MSRKLATGPDPVEALRNAVKAFAHYPDETVVTNQDLERSRELPNHYLTMRDLRGLLERVQDAFDSGFKAAGGTMIPDGARDMVELSLTREQLDVLADVAESLSAEDHWPAMQAFLETVSIYRRKK